MLFLRKIVGKGRRAFEKLERKLDLFEKHEENFASYAEAKEACSTASPYQDADLVDVVLAKTIRYINELQQDHFISKDELNSLFFLTPLLAKKTITVLDMGGACGAHYFFCRKILPKAIRLKWRIVETLAMVKKASALATEELSFYTDIKEATKGEQIDAVLASGVLPYVPNPYAALENIMRVQATYIAIHRTFFLDGDKDVIAIRKSRLSENGIGALPKGFSDREVQYPEITMSLNKFRSVMDSDYELFAEWDRQRDSHISGIERFTFSFCYRKKYPPCFENIQ